MRRPISAYLRPAAYASAIRLSWASTLSVILPSLPAWSSALMAANPILKQSLLRLTTGIDVIGYTHCHIDARYGRKRPHIHHIVLVYRPSQAYQRRNGVAVGHGGLLLKGNTKKAVAWHAVKDVSWLSWDESPIHSGVWASRLAHLPAQVWHEWHLHSARPLRLLIDAFMLARA